MSKLIEELKKRYKTPQEALQALGLDSNLLQPDEQNQTNKLANDELPKDIKLSELDRLARIIMETDDDLIISSEGA